MDTQEKPNKKNIHKNQKPPFVEEFNDILQKYNNVKTQDCLNHVASLIKEYNFNESQKNTLREAHKRAKSRIDSLKEIDATKSQNND